MEAILLIKFNRIIELLEQLNGIQGSKPPIGDGGEEPSNE